MSNQTLILTVGLPRSGKSTWARERGLPMVNPDSIRLALHGKPFIPQAEGFVWAIAYLMAKALLIAGHPTIIIDATNITKKRRAEWLKRFKRYTIVLEHFNTPASVCKERAIKDGKAELVEVISRMATEAAEDEKIHSD